jgi:hypothetical protein
MARDHHSVTGREHEQRDNHLQNLNVAVIYRERWPTPTARDHKDGQYNPNVPVNGLLGRAVWPTPMAADAERASETMMRGNPTLLGAVRRWPTPTANDHKPANETEVLEYRSTKRRTTVQRLRAAATEPLDLGGALNPTWVEWLMGFPLGWTDLGPSATRSSRRSSK